MTLQQEVAVPVSRRTGLLTKVAALVKGLTTTAQEALVGQRVTQMYPEEHYVPFPRWRGRHVLRRHENGLEKCVGCALCAAACPAHCIRVIAGENTDEHRISEGERYAEVYEIHMLRCIFCGYCVEACPTEALGMTGEYELATFSREAQLYGKERLLEPRPINDGSMSNG
jgi:NADH-quinone oxidoreductase subunit I